ncbi:MFS transporter [Natronorubrum texcoconense]|uniref:Sugar phosphate permease n=1 Tax=Natronorubrum texcoconense TaxID=1095776 RepID=A0A1G8YHF1_9EURY|nr:MFS transporter [Natronorubrum texcoconense]SDK02113.1 Sugar phosphate permease [Natronorubrum texcoconense]
MGSRTDANPRFRRGGTRYIVGAVSGAHFLSHVYLLAFPPLFPLLGAEFDLTTAQLGLLVTAIYLPTLFLQIPLGELVDRIGAKRILVGGLVVTSLGVSLSGLATGYWMLLAFAFLSGIGQSVFHPADYAFLESVTTSENQGTAFSLHTFGGFAGFAAAPVLVGGIGIRYGWQPALLAVGSLGFVYAAILLVTAAPVYRRQIREREQAASADGSGEPAEAAGSDDYGGPENERNSENEPDPDASDDDGGFVATVSQLLRPKLLVVFGFYLLSMMAIVGLQSFTTVFAVDSLGFGDASANNLLTAYLVGTAVGVIAGGPLADRLPFQPVLVVAFVAAAAGVFLAVIIPSSASFVAAAALFTCIGLAIGVALPSRDTFATTVAEAGSTGKSFGFFFTGLSLGAVISPALLGVVIDEVSVGAAFLVIVGILLVAASVIVGVSMADRRRSSGV